VVSSTPRPHFTPGKDLVPILQEAGWAPGPVWTGGKSRPHRDFFFFPPRSRTVQPVAQLLYRLSYPAHNSGIHTMITKIDEHQNVLLCFDKVDLLLKVNRAANDMISVSAELLKL